MKKMSYLFACVILVWIIFMSPLLEAQQFQPSQPASVWQVDEFVYCIHLNITKYDVESADNWYMARTLLRKSFSNALTLLQKQHPELEVVSIIQSPAPSPFGEYLVVFKKRQEVRP